MRMVEKEIIKYLGNRTKKEIKEDGTHYTSYQHYTGDIEKSLLDKYSVIEIKNAFENLKADGYIKLENVAISISSDGLEYFINELSEKRTIGFRP